MRMLWLIAAVMLAGCVDPGVDAGPTDQDQGDISPTDGISSPTGRAEGANGTLGLVIDLSSCDAGHCIDAVAINEGADDLHVSDICVEPWRDHMARDGEAVQHREGQMHCEAFGTRPFAAGEQLAFELAWDGQIWDEGDDATAPDGEYRWTVHVRAYESADGGEPIDVEASVTVVIGEA